MDCLKIPEVRKFVSFFTNPINLINQNIIYTLDYFCFFMKFIISLYFLLIYFIQSNLNLFAFSLNLNYFNFSFIILHLINSYQITFEFKINIITFFL